MRLAGFAAPCCRAWAFVGRLTCIVGLTFVTAATLALPARAADPWLFVNDVHLDPTSRWRTPIEAGGDTNPALLTSAINEMRRLAPNPPVIVMAGDFLAHHFKAALAEPTMLVVARRFGAAFPHAQFVIALGNEDSPCGDYAFAPDSHFLQAVATAWAPLVNRNGAAPDFLRTFAHDGFYTTKLPLENVRAVIVNDALWSTFYHDGCGWHGNATRGSFAELDRALAPGGRERRWLVMHIPPGIDASSTAHLTHRLAIVPFMRPAPRDAVLDLIADPARRIEVVVTGHVHRFAYRIIDRKGAPPVPLLISPAISPVLGNLPSFLTADVGPDGVIRNLEEHSFVDFRWQDVGGLGTLGASEFSGRALVNLQRRLEHDADLRGTYAALYMGDAPHNEINRRNWRSYWCAATAFSSTPFRDCVEEGGFSFLTQRGVAVVAAVSAVVLTVVLGLVALVFALRRRRQRMPSKHLR
jgi:predicted phosphodiesterase